MEYYLQLIINGLVVGSIYSLVALGFVIIFKATKVVNFAQGELVMVGAYVCFALTVQYQLPFLLSYLMVSTHRYLSFKKPSAGKNGNRIGKD